MTMTTMDVKLKPGNYKSGLAPVWCPGCGDFGILNSLYRAMAELQIEPWNTVILSGIGCSSRLPGYVHSYGFNGVHGRALTLATGVKVARPELTVIAVGGDGDGLAIGGNHLMHAARRNLDVTYILMDNEIYGLTKGQYSPTSRAGTVSPSSPTGSVDTPVSPGHFALGAGAKFFARAIDTDKPGLGDVLRQAHAFDGASFTEIFQNCIVYNEDVFAAFTDRRDAAVSQLHLEHGKPMLFGEDNGKGIRFNPDTFALEVIDANESPGDVLVHDERNAVVARLLIDLQLPVALGVIYRQPGVAYEEAFYTHHPTRMQRTKGVAEFIKGPNSWTVT